MRITIKDFKELKECVSNIPNSAYKFRAMLIICKNEELYKEDLKKSKIRRRKNPIKIKRKVSKISYEDSVIKYVKKREQYARYERGEL